MPTIHREGGYSFRFRVSDRNEPPHVHVEGHGGHAKFWLAGPRLENSAGYNRRQLAHIARIVEANASEFARKWNDYFA